MAAGDVTVNVVAADSTTVDTTLTAIRASCGANGHYGMIAIMNGQKILIWGIEEA
jgi:hypothetical protein